jgi:hypothetical protein
MARPGPWLWNVIRNTFHFVAQVNQRSSTSLREIVAAPDDSSWLSDLGIRGPETVYGAPLGHAPHVDIWNIC